MAFAPSASLRFATNSFRASGRAFPPKRKGTCAPVPMGKNYFDCLSSELRIPSSEDDTFSSPRSGGPSTKKVFVESTELRRIWEPSNADCESGLDTRSIATVLSYNVLAQSYVSSKIFDATLSKFLKARHRGRRLWEELRHLTATYSVDVLCLQELEVDQHGRLAVELPEFDRGSYKQRNAVGVRNKRDGCGVYWRKSKFLKVESVSDGKNGIVDEHVEFNSITEDPIASKVCEEKHELLRNCVGALVRLQDRNSGAKLVVGSVHVFWDPSFPKLKLAQAALFRRAAFTAAHDFETQNVVLAGDWNSLPSSAVYAFMTDSDGTRFHEEVRECSVDVLDGTLRQSDWDTGMLSTYRHEVKDSDCSTGEVPLTTFTPKFSGAIDHIFVSSNIRNGLLGSLSLPSCSDFIDARVEALPNGSHNSDHLPIISRLALPLE